MDSSAIPARGRLLVLGIVLLVAPAVLLAVTLLVLMLGRNVLLSDLSTVRIVELYVTKLVLFAVLGVLLYRFIATTLERQLPAAVDAVEREKREAEAAEGDDDERRARQEPRRDR